MQEYQANAKTLTELSRTAKEQEIQGLAEINPVTNLQLEFGDIKISNHPVIIGFGPAGMFAALLLAQNGINVLLKMFVLNNNYCDFDSIRQFALENSIPFKYDTRILSGSNSKEMTYQLDDKLSLELELTKSSTVVKYNEETFNYIVGTRSNKLFQCGAGRSSCWLKSNYHLRLCNFLDCIEYDLNKHTVADAWKLLDQHINDDIPKESKCYNCIYRKYCNYCPAVSFVGFKRTDMMFQNPIFCKNAESKASKDKESV